MRTTDIVIASMLFCCVLLKAHMAFKTEGERRRWHIATGILILVLAMGKIMR